MVRRAQAIAFERSPRARASACALLLALGLGCSPRADERAGPDELGLRIDAALDRAARFLVARQSPDGAWRSESYTVLADGLSLTPPVLKALLFAPGIEGCDDAVRRALDHVIEAAPPEPSGLAYPVYTASLAVIALSGSGGERELAARGRWLALLESHQLGPDLGWEPGDLAYGGFGYSLEPPRRGAPTGFDADLSSTLFALGAMRIAARPGTPNAGRLERALAFLRACQNLPLDPGAEAEPGLDDGGFFFAPANDAQNKAGRAGVDRTGRVRYRSYGSATADGVRALLCCGLAPEDPRVVAARRWLERRFDPERNAGDFDPVREIERASSYYYACWSLAHAFTALGVREIDTPRGRVAWAPVLARTLLERQSEDGAWRNGAGILMEDDPLVATPLACAALGLCRLATVAAPDARPPRRSP